ncbi:MAG: hypothetical protein K8T90_02405 [Planctomycetes bacterium]|nr:hypothetical protein [Planctomycetota bacterium]
MKSVSTKLFASFLALTLGVALAQSSAFASEASEAHKAALELKAAIKKAGSDEAARTAAQTALKDFAKSKADILQEKRGSLTKLDLMYLGLIQCMAGNNDTGIETLRVAVEKKEETKYGANIHANLVQALLDANQPDGAAVEVDKMLALYTEAKEVKIAVMNLGMAYRGALNFEKSAHWLQKAFDLGDMNATKPLVNDLLMLGKQEAAVAAAQLAIEKGVPQQKDDMQTLKDITEKIGSDVTEQLKFDAFVPSGGPDMTDKVVVLIFSHGSAKTFKVCLKLCDKVKKLLADDVVPILTTTYYKKNFESGKIDDSVTPEMERDFGAKLVDQENWRGWMGYLKDEAATKAWGVSALPHVVIVSKDRKLLFAHTFDLSDRGDRDWAVMQKVLESAAK